MKFKELAEEIKCDICNHSLDVFFNIFDSYEKVKNSVYTCHCQRDTSVNLFEIDSISTGVFLVEENEHYRQLFVIKNKLFLITFCFDDFMEFSGIENINYKGNMYPEYFYKFDNYENKLSGKELTELIPLIRKDLINYNNNLIFQ
jgi:hypothetical protein